MSSANDTSGTNDNGQSNNGNSDQIALVALIISIIAFVTTFAQVIQQFFASADGYRRCNKGVMSKWAKKTRRRWSWREFRFEVLFEAPVIFTAAPSNKNGPVKGQDILLVTGTKKSYEDTHTVMPHRGGVAQVHTVDDARASWVNLLLALQAEENQSRAWDEVTPPTSSTPRRSLYEPAYYSIAYCVQTMQRSWDFMPDNVQKPYATTTVCHMVEIMVMLGLHWKEFVLDQGKFRAEGNGFMLTSTTIHGLGAIVYFAQTGSSSHEGDRVVPCHSIKELSFGLVDSIIELEYPNDKKIKSLRLGDGDEDLWRTLALLGVNKEDRRRFKEKRERYGMFGVTFELVAMVAEVFRIRGSKLGRLPNPCSTLWAPHLNLPHCWRLFREHFMELWRIDVQLQENDLAKLILKLCNKPRFSTVILYQTVNLDVREAAHDALDEIKAFFQTHPKPQALKSVLASHLSVVLKGSEDISAVLFEEENPYLVDFETEHKTSNDAKPSKEEALMKLYFYSFRDAVVNRPESEKTTAAVGQQPQQRPQQQHLNDRKMVEKEAIWLALNFRMWCWFLLHDFHGEDRLIVPSQFHGSRLPVFIG